MEDVVLQDPAWMPEAYEPPSLTVLGSVHVITQAGHGRKMDGHSDGFSFTGFTITNAS